MGPGPTAVNIVGPWPTVRAAKARGVCLRRVGGGGFSPGKFLILSC